MKTNFNIAKNVRNSRSISALSALRKLHGLGLLLCALLVGSLQVWGATYSVTVDQNASGNNNVHITTTTKNSSQTVTYNAVSWTFAWAGNGVPNSGNKSQCQFGSASNPCTSVTINTSGISGTITEVAVTTWGASSNNAEVEVTVGGTNFTNGDNTTVAIGTSSSAKTFTHTGKSGEIVITISQTTSKAIYVSGISVTYSTGPTLYTVTFDANGGSVTPATATQASAGAAIALPTPTRDGYNCTGWFTATSGGTKRGDAGGSYTPTASETIHAQWTAVTYTNYRTSCATDDPSLTADPNSITGLGYIVGNSPVAKSFSMSGSNLESGTITVTAPTNFEVCKTSGGTYTSSITFTGVSGTLAATTVYVRLAAGKSAGEYSGNVTISGCGLASNVTVALSGTVSTPTITATPGSITGWTTQTGSAPDTKSVTVTGANLKGVISASLTGTNASDFSISPSEIAKATAEGAGGTITITYTGSYASATTKSATLQLTATDADPVNVSISFEVQDDPREKFELLTSSNLSQLGDGAKLVLINSGRTLVMNETQNSTTGHEQTSTGWELQSSNTILAIAENNPQSVQVLELVETATANVYALYTGSKYLCNTASNKLNEAASYSETSAQWTISVDENGYAIIDAQGGQSQQIGYNSGASGAQYRCYNSGYAIYAYFKPSNKASVTLTSSLSKFEYVYGSGASASQTFTVSGINLGANLVVSVPSAAYEVSKNGTSDWSSSVSYEPSTGTVSDQTVYIRLKAGLGAGAYDFAAASGLRVTSTGATEKNAALTGEVKYSVSISSNNGSYGSVSPTSTTARAAFTVTATPESGYRVISGAGGYEVTDGTATVVNNGNNTFTVTPTSNCAITIKFEAIPTHKVTYWATGTKIQESDVQEGAAIPDQTTETASGIEAYCGNRDHFVGWTTNSSYSDATDAPAGMITSMSPGGTMSTRDVNYYAVFANTGSGGGTTFSRVTDKSTLADGDVIAIVAEQSGGQIFSTSADHKGGGKPTETDGKITVSASTNRHTLEAVDGGWKLHKDNSNILQADLAYGAYGNTMTIVDAVTANYFYIKKNSNNYLEYWSNTWQFYQSNSPNNGNIRLKIYKQDAGYVDYTTQCCSLKPVTDVVVSGSANNSVTLSWTLPSSTTGITKFQIIDVDNANNVVVDNISTSATNATITSLTKCNTYHYKVVSYSDECTVSSSTIEAQPFGDVWTVTFNYNEGTGTPASFTTSCGNLSTTLPSATRDGYTFLGWWTESSAGSKVGDAEVEYPVTGTTTIYAHWAQNYSITYDRVGGTNVCANETCGAGMTYTVCGTEPTRSGYIFGGWLSDEATPHTYNAGETFTMPAANVTLTAQWTANWRNLTFNVPTGGGSASGVPSGNHVRDGQSFTMPTITGKADSKWCWTFLGWTETAPNESGRWDVTPSYIAGGATSGAITSDKVYYAVYSKTGAGASGDVECDAAAITAIGTGGGHAYADLEWTISAADLSSWKARAYVGNKGTYLQIKEDAAVYIKLPTVGGNYTSITLNHNSNSSSRTIVYRTTTGGSNVASHTTPAYATSSTIDISGGSTTGYIMMTGSYTYQITSISAHFGPPTVYGYTLDDCPCVVEEFDLTYDANATNFPGSTTTCTGVTDYRWEDHENEYTICSTEPTLEGYKFTHWATNANGSGTTYNAGEVITCVGETPITLYARYERVYTVTFDNQGTLTPVTQASAGAAIDVPSATSSCSAEWAFVGWSETEIAPMSFLPSIEIASGTSTYTPTADKTLYAIYRKTTTSDPFVAGMSGTYKITNGSTVYAGACNNSKLPETDAAGAAVFYIKYTSADGGKYTIQQADGKYLKYAGSSTSLALDNETPYYWTMTKNGDLWHVLGVGTDRYLQYSSGTGFKAYNTSGPTDIAFVAAEGQYYYRTMSCAEEFDITFHANGTTINWVSGYPEASYQNLADATVVSTFPTATFDGWTFLGWRISDYTESTTAPTSASIYSTGGNALTISSADVDLYPVFTRFEDNEPFDEINGGDYFIYFLDEGSDDGYGNARRVYAATYSDNKRYHSSALCSEATGFTFTKLENGNWTIYDKTTKKYLYGVADNDLKQKTVTTGAEWTLTVNGNQFDAFHVGTSYGQISAFGNGESATFMNYSRTNIGSNPSYHRVYLGGCTNRTFTTNPSTTPNIEIHGQVKVTSTATKSVKARSVLTVTASNISTANLTVTSDNSAFKFCLTSNGTYTASVNIPVVSNKVGITPIYIEYTPAAGSTSDGVEGAIVTVSDGAGTPTSVSTLSGDVQGRHLPENFVIAAKWGGNWYALPANCTTSSSSTAGIPIIVDNVSDPTSATALSTTKYGLQTVKKTNGSGDRYADYGIRLVFTEQLTTATADNQKTLYNGSKTSIQVYTQYSGYAASNPERFEWLPTTTDFKDYLLTSAATLTGEEAEDGEQPRTISINNSGVFGTLMQDKSYDGKVRLLPATWVDPAELQIVEWKANSVVVMYLGNATTATTKVGSNDATSAQTLSGQEMMHGVYELTTTQALTSNAGEQLLITLNDASQKIAVIPMIVASSVTASADVANDVVVLNDVTFTAAATKYSFKNITVYGGGKLSIPDGTSIGMSSLTLRAGRLTTNGSGKNVAYSYDYPQVALSGTMTNTAAKINLDYITDYNHWYHLTVPFAAKLKDITRPVEFYGSAVAANNNGSWEIDCYDGSIRATGVYNSWQDIEGADYLGASGDDRALTAGHGYMMWAAPLNVRKTGEETKTRQTYGIHRFVMDVTAADAKTAEMTNKIVDVYAHPAEKNNDYGWNMVGNPYMANLSEMASTTLKVGKLVEEMKDDKWTGKWIWDKDTQTQNYRYVTVPANDFSSYEAVKVKSGSDAETVSLSPFKVFFIQVDGETANQEKSLVFDHTKRAASIASYTRLINEEVETGMIMQHANYADEKLGFLLSDEYSDAYEKQADYPKMMNPTNYNLYGVHEVGELSFVATSPTIASTSMAIGYQVPEAGDYTLSFDENGYDRDEVKNLYVTDYGVEPNVTTDLMEKDYIFHVNEAETNNTRFVVSIVLTPKEPDDPGVQTSLEAVDGQNNGPIKFIYQDKMYILYKGVIYDAVGKRVSEINK